MTPGSTSADSPRPDSRDELARLVRSWRERLDLADFPGLHAKRARRSRRKVSQEDVADLAGYSSTWIGNLERGVAQTYTHAFLKQLANTLRLNEDEKHLLYLLATGAPPPAEPNRAPAMQDTAPLHSVLKAQPWPAYVNDEAWDLVAYNTHMQSWFPWVAGHENNIMRWVFTFPEARVQLHRWDTDWAPQMLAQMRFAQARFPGNDRLAEVIAEILDCNKDARRLWDRPFTYVHPDGDHRSLYLPRHEEVKPIELVALEPLRAPGHRVMMLLPLSDSR